VAHVAQIGYDPRMCKQEKTKTYGFRYSQISFRPNSYVEINRYESDVIEKVPVAHDIYSGGHQLQSWLFSVTQWGPKAQPKVLLSIKDGALKILLSFSLQDPFSPLQIVPFSLLFDQSFSRCTL